MFIDEIMTGRKESLMGKAYTDEEKEQIHIRIMEEGIKLFHENGSKTLSIRELTKRVGISQGGFYNFYSDKDQLILAISTYRMKQKLADMQRYLEQSLDAPLDFLVRYMYRSLMDIAAKARESQMYADMISVLTRTPFEDSGDGEEFLEIVFSYWREHGWIVCSDTKGLLQLMAAVWVLIDNEKKFDPEYLDEMIYNMLEEGVKRYVHITK